MIVLAERPGAGKPCITTHPQAKLDKMTRRFSRWGGAGQGARGGTGGAYAEPLRKARHRTGGTQNSSLRAFAGKALTMVLAGFAFTITTLPKISRFPALVAFFWRVLIITTPGMTNLPFFFASVVAMLARVVKAVLITPLFPSQLSASAAVRALLVMTVDFIIGAISVAWARKQRRSRCFLVCANE